MKIAIIAALFAPLSAIALDLKGVAPGMTQAQITEKFGLQTCRIYDQPKPLDECQYTRIGPSANVTELNTLAEELVNFWHFQFADTMLYNVVVSAGHNSFRPIRDALIAKNGNPRATTTEQLQNMRGVKISGAVLRWSDGDADLVLHEYGGTIESMMITFTSRKLAARAQSNRAEEIAKRAKDL
jgi:hypothetical protein